MAKSVRIFLPDGNPTGLMICEVVNWTGRVIAVPRNRLVDLVERREAAKTGVYLLTGPDPDRISGTIAYVGEADSVGARLRRHDADERMDFFNRAAIIVSSDDNLTKAHARFLEGRLIKLAQDAATARIMNATAPEFARLPEADLADMTAFLDQLLLVLSILGFDLLRPAQQAAAPSTSSENPEFVFETLNAAARARETDDAFIVLAGSRARREATATLPTGYRIQREQLIAEGQLVLDADTQSYKFVSDTAFSSPSAAASIIAARSASGPREWKLSSGMTYGDWRATQLDGGD